MKKLSILMLCLVIFLFSLPCAVTAEEIAAGENMIFIKGGCFQMGDTFGGGDTDEQPVHKVCVDDFHMGKYEVTQKEWVDVMETNPSHFKGCDNCPIENVSWDDIQEYINKLNQKTGKRYRLPTEAEWEYAARSGGKSEKYSGTNSNSEVSGYAWYISNSETKTHPAGQKKSNGLGIYDMTGNVWEWVQDWYDENYYKSSPENNPQGPSNGNARVLRGGSWRNYSRDIRSANRNKNNPDVRSSHIGFRLVLSSREMELGTPQDKNIENMIFIKGGCFQMGDTFGGGDTDEQPVHKVCVDDFHMGKYEVTQKEWVDVMETNPSHFKGCDNCPIENVSWDDIQEYINKLNQKTGKRYRLPTEAEWEYAARSGGKSEKYSGTSSKSEVSGYAWYISNSETKTHPAGQKKSNGLGIHDMTGNVWEWVQDWYDENYYKSSPENNPQGPSNGNARVLRGGSWHTSQGHVRSTYRNREHPGKRSSSGGFRCVMAD